MEYCMESMGRKAKPKTAKLWRMNFDALVKRAHENAVKHGFWPEGEEPDIPRTLMLIVSEIGEVIEADRKGRHADIKKFEESVVHDLFTEKYWCFEFERQIKDTYEDEIADTLIRIFDFCGRFNISLSGIKAYHMMDTGVTRYTILSSVCHLISVYPPIILNHDDFRNACALLLTLCEEEHIDIVTFIAYKMRYNESRPYKHGKEY